MPTSFGRFTHEQYIGSYVQGKRRVVEVGSSISRLKNRSEWFIIPDHHPPLVEKGVFEEANRNIRRFKISEKKIIPSVLRGKVYCDVCRHAMYLRRNCNPVYVCRTSKGNRAMACCGLVVGKDELEKLLLDILRRYIEAVLEKSKAQLAETESHLPDAAAYTSRIQQIDAEKSILYEKLLQGEVSREEYISRKSVLDAELQRKKNASAFAQAQIQKTKETREIYRSYERFLDRLQQKEGLTDDVVDAIVDKVFVFPDKRIEIAYKTQDPFSDNTLAGEDSLHEGLPPKEKLFLSRS